LENRGAVFSTHYLTERLPSLTYWVTDDKVKIAYESIKTYKDDEI
jgi:hypothetical protein